MIALEITSVVCNMLQIVALAYIAVLARNHPNG
jgi:hypothetical protein